MNRAMEEKRIAGIIGQNLDARLTLFLADDRKKQLEATNTDLKDAFIVSSLVLRSFGEANPDCYTDPETEGIAIMVEKAPGEKCARCWSWNEEMGHDQRWPDVCPRCAKVLDELAGKD